MKNEIDYIAQDVLGFHWYFGYKNATEVWAHFVTSSSNLDDVIATDSHELHDWLKEREYSSIRRTGIDTVWELVK